MKKILQIIDSPAWAIGHLAQAILVRNPHYEFKQIVVHPKELGRGQLDLIPVKQAIEWADVVDIQYWRTGSQLLEMMPELKQKKIILTHQNDENLLSYDWKDVDLLVGRTKYAYEVLEKNYPGKAAYSPIGIDLDEFEYHGQEPKEMTVGYVGRIVEWKGLKEIAQACFELGYPLLVMGKMDKPAYWESIPREHRDNMVMDWFNCEDFARKEAYQNMTIYVGNSGPGRESGTMPYMEAMAMGVPVVTTPSGIAADVAKDRENALLVGFNDYDALKAAIKEAMEFPSLRQKLRENAWETVKNLNWDRMARTYDKLYNRAYFTGQPQVSVIIPATLDRAGFVNKILISLENSTYKNIEAVVVWDELLDNVPDQPLLQNVDLPVKQLFTNDVGYNLAMARNLGVIEATGKYLMFCDSRICPDSEAVEKFLTKVLEDDRVGHNPAWYFGEKGGGKKTFVENFSFISRKDLIVGGMFNERVNQYGGMSQELRERFDAQGFRFEYLPEVKSEQLVRSSARNPERRKSIIKMKNLLAKLEL